MDAETITLSKALTGKSMTRRRDFHEHPKMVWFEMWTSATIAKALTGLGYEVLTGKAVYVEQVRIGIPSEEALEEHAALAMEQGTPAEYLTGEMEEGYTGVVGILCCREEPAAVPRFDIDALGLHENGTDSHRPHREGFASVNEGAMHVCGHDGHTAIDPGVVEVLIQLEDRLHGTVKLLFQPSKRDIREIRAMVANGHLDDVSFFVGIHITPDNEPDDGDVIPDTYGSLATIRYDAYCHGQTSHAGGFPEKDVSAIMAVANAVVNLTATPKHSNDISQINIGTIEGGIGWNAVSDGVGLQIKVRRETMETS